MDKPPIPPGAASNRDKLVSMLGLISSQIEAALHETDAPAATLVETAHAMGKATQVVARCMFDFAGSPARVFEDLMVLHDELHTRSSRAATAIQFHDRLVQCLTHICGNLSSLADFLSSGPGPTSAANWDQLRERISKIHSMEQEQILFDPTDDSASADEEQTAPQKNQGRGVGKVELF